MSEYTVIADVGKTLVNILWQEISADPVVSAQIDAASKISLESPFDLKGNNSVRLSVYLYRIVEDPHSKNRYPVPGPVGMQRKPPLTLDLFYLVTPLLGSPEDQQIVLGKVMQVFYDRAVIEGSDLAGGLAGTDESLHLILNPVSLEESTRIWNALEQGYRLSVCYVARVAMVDSTRVESLRPVVERESEYAAFQQGAGV
ncbi:MAG: DUF4255 domain-containing protein [Gemmatimonadota bacterium]|jgi:hypothetical protein